MITRNHGTSLKFQCNKLAGGLLHTLKRIPTFMVIALLSLGNHVLCGFFFLSQHLNPPSALSDHRESVAWLISDSPHRAAYCYKLGPHRLKAECLCLHKAATIFQHTHATANCAWPQPPTTKDMKTIVTTA